jgi:hypothetical protein
MSYPTSTRNGKRFLGNSSSTKMEVHDLTKEDKNPNGCQIDEFLRAGHGVYFIPDALQQAHNEGYDNCAKCLGNSRR